MQSTTPENLMKRKVMGSEYGMPYLAIMKPVLQMRIKIGANQNVDFI